MAKFNYNKMKDTADRLLDRFAQGSIEYVSVTTQPPENSWDDPIEVITRAPVDAVARGVSSQFVDGVTILSTDLQVISSSPMPVGSRMEIDSKPVVIVRYDKLPAAGVTVAHRYIVR